ncbi:MAG: D-alanyl-D-alanine carboxypeptidase [Erysipelotrichaceae bacterium]|nr:D-alanyl-D-alanine carboxypeptidase [Erysipelotrichaceae bacterium]
MKKLFALLTVCLLLCPAFPVKAATKLEVRSEYVYIEDTGIGQVLYEKNADVPMYPASLTKMMSVILAIENIPNTGEIITITEEMLSGLAEANASVVGYDVGDEVRVIDLLYGSLLSSGADCINALAFRTSGSIDAFVELMNQKAQDLGMESTHFCNPTGLHEPDHVSTARDMALLLRYCRSNALFKTILAADNYISDPVASNEGGFYMRSWFRDEMSAYREIEGYEGGKTGYTSYAGYCLASSASRNDMQLLAIVCDSPSFEGRDALYQEVYTLYNYFFDNYERQTLMTQGEHVGSVRVIDGAADQTLDFYALNTFTTDLRKDSLTVENTLPSEIYAPAKLGDTVGSIKYYSDGELIYQEDYRLQEDIKLDKFGKFSRQVGQFFGHADPFEARAKAPVYLTVILVLLLATIPLSQLIFGGRKKKQ